MLAADAAASVLVGFKVGTEIGAGLAEAMSDCVGSGVGVFWMAIDVGPTLGA